MLVISLGLWALAATFIPTSQGAIHQMVAGDPAGSSLAFYPSTVSADVNDTVVFTFNHRHTVTQAAFDRPCNNGTAASSFDSGYLNPGQNFTVTVITKEPIWIRCNGNCVDGMVAAINPPESGNRTYKQYQENARATYGSPTTSNPYGSSSPTSTVSTTTTSRGAATSRSTIFHPTAIMSGIMVLILGTLAL